MTPDQVAEAVAAILTAGSPDGIRVTYDPDEGMLWYFYDRDFAYMGDRRQPSTGFYWLVNLRMVADDEDLDRLESYVGTCQVLLDQFQDFVAEATGTAWPGTSSQPGAGARFTDGCLTLFYGEPDAPALILGEVR